jgi:8-oxo-dGTP diphosphatase
MTLYLVRHADAKSRGGWAGDDHLRPLTKRGHRQARQMVETMGSAPIQRILSSEALRCIETVMPLSAQVGVPVDVIPALTEGADGAKAIELIRSMVGLPGDSVACAHGDLIPEILRALARAGAHYDDQLRWPKGSVWVLTVDGKRVVSGSIVEASG